MAAFQATYFTAVTRAGIAVTALVAICSEPIMIAALAALLLGSVRRAPGPWRSCSGVARYGLLVVAPAAGTTAAAAGSAASSWHWLRTRLRALRRAWKAVVARRRR